MGRLLLSNYQPIVDNFFSNPVDKLIGNFVIYAMIMSSYPNNQSLFLKEFPKPGII